MVCPAAEDGTANEKLQLRGLFVLPRHAVPLSLMTADCVAPPTVTCTVSVAFPALLVPI